MSGCKKEDRDLDALPQKREVKNVGGSQEQIHLNPLFGPVTVYVSCPT
jgi:hypothetical protein